MITLDCADKTALGTFWAEMLGGTVVYTDDRVSVVHTERGTITAVTVPEYQPPTWPNGATPKHIHLELVVADLDIGEREALRLGAQRAAEQPEPDRWRVLLDPAGHPFCLTMHLPLMPLGPRPAEQAETESDSTA